MTLSMLILAALVPINLLSVRSVIQIQNIETEVNKLSQSVTVLESDLKATAVTACTLNKALITKTLRDEYSNSPKNTTLQWISGFSNNSWFPQTPQFTNSQLVKTFDAIQVLKTNVSEQISLNTATQLPQRILFLTNCSISEISRSIDSKLLQGGTSSSDLYIYPFQFIHYYIKDNDDKFTLYRQFMSKTGRPITEPVIDNIHKFSIAYGEVSETDTLSFKTANAVDNWRNVVVVYVSITLAQALIRPFSILVPLKNHASD